MDLLLKKKEELNLLKNKYQKRLFAIENDLILIEKEFCKFSEDILLNSLNLSEQQQQIVDATQDNILCIACPGAGKTHTLISRYVNLILNKGVKPDSVLLITFSKKAGQEMMNRLEEIIPDKLPFHVGSLHGLSYRILQKYNNINYTVLDDLESRELLKSEATIILNQYNLDNINIDDDDIDLIKKKITSIIDKVSITYPLNFKNILKKLNLSKYLSLINQIYKAFSKKKRAENYIDFNDLMIMFCDFLKSSKSDDFKTSIKYIFFDEYQDINPIQNYILTMFKSYSKIMVVGDDAQSIYSFRGSSVKFILDFEKNFIPNEKYLLVKNYRSSPAIVNFCEDIINRNTKQFKKEVKSIQDENGMLPDIHAFDKKSLDSKELAESPETSEYKTLKDFSSQEEQYKWVINDIINKNKNGVKLSDIVILARKNDLLNKIELELINHKIPCIKQSGLSLLDKPHIKDFLAFIIILNNNKSSIHWKRIISLHKGFNISSANNIIESATNIIETIKDLSLNNSEMLNLYSFLNQINNIYKDKAKANFILTYLETLWEGKNKTYDIYKKDILELLYYLRNSSLNDFIMDLYLNQDIQTDFSNQIFLSTVHGSKGLEWNHVYIIDVNNNDFPSVRSQFFKDELDEMEEERRLFYVACSRAKKFLTITYHKDQQTNISPFLRELKQTLYLNHNLNISDISINNIIPKDVSNIIKNYGHKNICLMLKDLNWKEKSIHPEISFSNLLNRIKNKKIIGNFFDYLIPKIIQNNYPEKIKKFNLNIIHKDENFSKKIYHEYIDENNHWSNLLLTIFYISTYKLNQNDIDLKNCRDILLKDESLIFYKELEQGIKKLVELFKPKNIYSHYNINFGSLKGEIDLLFDDTIIEIKVSNQEICNLQYLCQTLTYGYLMAKKDHKINKICLYNVQNGIINIIDTNTFDFEVFYKNLFLF